MTDEERVAFYRCNECGHTFRFELIKLIAPFRTVECPKCVTGTARLGPFDNVTNLHATLEPVFKALGKALDIATQIDPRRKGIPSTKGVID